MCGSHREAWRRWCGGALHVTLSVIYLEFEANLPSMDNHEPERLALNGISETTVPMEVT
ncbi:unnamed protein product [Oncorhynchus mykiss]|uniref:Enhancer of polycomb C-terminal domain-containing protein n=1 Tax=Oncorhynchus mykiss TaxID=8022 RepID=A0A060Y026_ONCMY|nr:unnamed protein product [Oncorhynchus mykiss]